MANDQPDFDMLGQSLEVAATQFKRFSNTTPFSQGERINSVQNQITDVQGQLVNIWSQMADLQREHVLLRTEMNNNFSQLTTQISRLETKIDRVEEQTTTLSRQYQQDRTTQQAQQHNYFVKTRNQHDLMINPGHQLLPLRSVLTGAKIPECPRTKESIYRLSHAEADRFLAALGFPQRGNIAEKRRLLADSFC